MTAVVENGTFAGVADLEEFDRHRPGELTVQEAPKQCRIALAKSASGPVRLEWHPGKGGHRSVIVLKPGESVIQPLVKAEVWFGPFTVPARYIAETDERKKATLQEFWRTEKARALDRYDYPRVGIERRITGPHRFPDVTVTVLEADGSESETIRLHELYRIGEFDPAKEEIERAMGVDLSADAVRAEYEAKLAEKDSEVAALAKQVAELSGLVKGYMAGAQRAGGKA